MTMPSIPEMRASLGLPGTVTDAAAVSAYLASVELTYASIGAGPVSLVTLEEAKLYIRVDGDMDDLQIVMMINAATEAALQVADGWNGEGEPPARLKLAVLSHVAQFYDCRDDPSQPEGTTRLLMPLRNLDV